MTAFEKDKVIQNIINYEENSYQIEVIVNQQGIL